MRKTRPSELAILATAIGIIATFAAPWLELRGTFSAWRIVEWHTFWRGESAFMLGDVVAANYRIPIEFATMQMQDLTRGVLIVGAILGVWHAFALVALLVAGARLRLRVGASRGRVAFEIVALLAINLIALGVLVWLLALPSSLDTKVDFRLGTEIHTDSLIWSSVTLLPVAPLLAILAVIAQIIALSKNRKS
ncbi:MAG: hypothetical protein HY868_27670 [Chloroflexi bacterium]|nr:hypothetical protein [Chloroflexota bacterium]